MGRMDTWQTFGKHSMRVDGDVVFVRAVGQVSSDEIVALLDRMLIVSQQYGYVFEVVDAKAGGTMDAPARRRNAEWHKQHALQIECVIFGANRLVGAMVTLLANAFRLLGRQQISIRFVETEEDAWQWVTQRRAELTQGARAGRS